MTLQRETFRTTIQLYDQSVPLLRKGERFTPITSVARHLLPPPRVFYISALSGLSKVAIQTAKVEVLVKKGQTIEYGEPIARIQADFAGQGVSNEEMVKAPVSGIVEEVIENSGNILIRELLDPRQKTEVIDISSSIKKRKLFGRRLSFREGSFIEKGQMLAEGGDMRSPIESPISGIIRSIDMDAGKVVVERQVQEIPVPAGFYGEVEEVGENFMVLAGEGDVLYGRTGIGPEGWGVLNNIGEKSNSAITPSRVNHVLTGKILVGGSIVLESLQMAAKNGAAGVITGYARHADLSTFAGKEIVLNSTGSENTPYPVVITSGFGIGSMDEELSGELLQREGWWTYLLPRTQMRAGVIRPRALLQPPSN